MKMPDLEESRSVAYDLAKVIERAKQGAGRVPLPRRHFSISVGVDRPLQAEMAEILGINAGMMRRSAEVSHAI